MKTHRVTIKGPDDLDILSAIWILSCNDENPIITYKGIKYRLGLPDDYDIRSLIQSRGELFRLRTPAHRLEEWKAQMKAGKHLPSWIRDIEETSTREAKIDGLSTEDVFRNQFRSEAAAPILPIEVIKWGLEHIDRLRKAGIEAREEKTKKITGMWIPVLSMLVALTAVVSSAVLQNRSINTQVDLKKYETSFKPKQEGYALFMESVWEGFESAYKGDTDRMGGNLKRIEIAYYKLEPFLNESKQNAIWEQYQQFQAMCLELIMKEPAKFPKRDKYFESFLWYKKYFRNQLYEALFKT